MVQVKEAKNTDAIIHHGNNWVSMCSKCRTIKIFGTNVTYEKMNRKKWMGKVNGKMNRKRRENVMGKLTMSSHVLEESRFVNKKGWHESSLGERRYQEGKRKRKKRRKRGRVYVLRKLRLRKTCPFMNQIEAFHRKCIKRRKRIMCIESSNEKVSMNRKYHEFIETRGRRRDVGGGDRKRWKGSTNQKRIHLHGSKW